MKLEVKNISKVYNKKEVLKNINFELEPGEILALVGRNGSGKTTLLRILIGMLNRDSGEILLNEKSVEDNMDLKGELLYIPDRFDYFKKTKIKNIPSYYSLVYPKFDEKYFFEQLLKNKLDKGKTIKELSKGETVIFSIILAMACNTKFIFLDEPLDGLDVINIDRVFDYLLDAQEKNIALIITSHRLDYLIKISNKIYYLDCKEVSASSDVDLEIYKKYQVVYNDKIPQEILENSNILLLNSIGRVYTILVYDPDNTFENILNKTKLIQYDKIGVTLEDVFLYKNREEK